MSSHQPCVRRPDACGKGLEADSGSIPLLRVYSWGTLSESLPPEQSHDSEREWEDGEELIDPADGALRWASLWAEWGWTELSQCGSLFQPLWLPAGLWAAARSHLGPSGHMSPRRHFHHGPCLRQPPHKKRLSSLTFTDDTFGTFPASYSE